MKASGVNGWSTLPPTHCTPHYTHHICQAMRSFNRKKFRINISCTCTQIPATTEEKARRDKTRISKLTQNDIGKAVSAHQITPKETIITLELETSKALIKRLHETGHLSLRQHRHSPSSPLKPSLTRLNTSTQRVQQTPLSANCSSTSPAHSPLSDKFPSPSWTGRC